MHDARMYCERTLTGPQQACALGRQAVPVLTMIVAAPVLVFAVTA
jgi:hypothetical protein